MPCCNCRLRATMNRRLAAVHNFKAESPWGPLWLVFTVAILPFGSASDLTPFVVRSGADFVQALRSSSITYALLVDNVRLVPSDWGDTVVVRTTNFTLKGLGAEYVLIDFSFLTDKLMLAPGVVLRLQDLETRNAQSGIGFGIDLLAASPGSTVELVDDVVFAFACLPAAVMIPAISMFNFRFDGANTTSDPNQLVSLAPGSWCRATPGINSCYVNNIKLRRVAVPIAEYDPGRGPQRGGYVTMAYNSLAVCHEAVLASQCPQQLAYEDCIISQRQQLYEQDRTWERLAAVNASRASAARGSRSAGLSAGAIAGIAMSAAVGALVLLAAGLGLFVWLRRRHLQRLRQLSVEDSPSPSDAMAAQPAKQLIRQASSLRDAQKLSCGGAGDNVGAFQYDNKRPTVEISMGAAAKAKLQPADIEDEIARHAMAMENVRVWLAKQQLSPPPSL